MENERYNVSPAVQQAKLRYGIVGNAPALSEAVERALRVAPIDLSVLVTGESGTGKEFFPQIVRMLRSDRAGADLCCVDTPV